MGGVRQYGCRCLLLKRCAQEVVCKRDEEGEKIENTVLLSQPIVDAIIGKYFLNYSGKKSWVDQGL